MSLPHGADLEKLVVNSWNAGADYTPGGNDRWTYGLYGTGRFPNRFDIPYPPDRENYPGVNIDSIGPAGHGFPYVLGNRGATPYPMQDAVVEPNQLIIVPRVVQGWTACAVSWTAPEVFPPGRQARYRVQAGFHSLYRDNARFSICEASVFARRVNGSQPRLLAPSEVYQNVAPVPLDTTLDLDPGDTVWFLVEYKTYLPGQAGQAGANTDTLLFATVTSVP